MRKLLTEGTASRARLRNILEGSALPPNHSARNDQPARDRANA